VLRGNRCYRFFEIQTRVQWLTHNEVMPAYFLTNCKVELTRPAPGLIQKTILPNRPAEPGIANSSAGDVVVIAQKKTPSVVVQTRISKPGLSIFSKVLAAVRPARQTGKWRS
jgi:hypothetical protein